MAFSVPDFHYWPLLTRLGEMQLLVPAALIAIWRMHREADARPLAAWWMLSLAVVAAGAKTQRYGRSGNADGFGTRNTVFAADAGINRGRIQISTCP
jgi:hypothetical protein